METELRSKWLKALRYHVYGFLSQVKTTFLSYVVFKNIFSEIINLPIIFLIKNADLWQGII